MKQKYFNARLAPFVLAAFSLVWHLVTPAAAGEPPAVQVKISWRYENMPPGLKIYEIRKDAETALWDTDSVAAFSETPAGKEIGNSTFLFTPGGKKEFVLVYHNKTSESIHFFAAPHHMDPEKNALGYKFKCLCVNHIFTARSGEYWYRVVDLHSLGSIEGKDLEITHTLIGVDPKRHEEYYEKPRVHF